MKYSKNIDYLVAASIYLATQRGWWARTPSMLASELSLDKETLSKVFDRFPGIFRKSRRPSKSGEHFYSLQARYALRNDYSKNEEVTDIPTLPIENLQLLYSFIQQSAASEQNQQRTLLSNIISISAALIAAGAAVYVATFK